MRHLTTHKLQEQIRGMELEFKIKAPEAVNVNPILERATGLFAWAQKDPEQFGLFDEQKPKPEDDEASD